MRSGTANTGDRSPRLQCDDRLPARDTARDPEELPRVAERLEVERDDLGGGVVLPKAEQVIAADVDLVTDRDEIRDPDPGAGGFLE